VPKFETDLTRKEECDEDGVCSVGAGRGGEAKANAKRPDKGGSGSADMKGGLAQGGKASKGSNVDKTPIVVQESVLQGGAIMPKLENATAR
jgi:hypothetical protein